MVLRNSLVKFQVPAEKQNPEIPLRIVSVAENYHPAAFNKPLLKALEDIGATKEEILNIYRASFDSLAKVSRDSLNLLRSTADSPTWSGRLVLGCDILLQLCFILADRGIFPENYGDSFLKMFMTKVLEERHIEGLFKIPIPGSYTALGLTDDCQILGPDEVYIRATGTTITGRVLIYRNPIIHIGDIQWAQALSDQQMDARIGDLNLSTEIQTYIKSLKEPAEAKINLSTSITSMDNVIFFSQKDPRPFPNMLSGGDLDGDKYHILPENCSFLSGAVRTQKPANYDPDKDPEPATSDWSMDALSKFVGSYIRNDCLGLLSKTLLIISDWLPEGLDAKECKDLAVHISRAVDFQKNGVPVDFKKLIEEHNEFRTASKPDFYKAVDAKAYYDKRGEYYTSNKLLGDIYHAAKDVKFSEFKIDDSALEKLIGEDSKKLFTLGKASEEMKAMLRPLVGGGFTNYRIDLKSQSTKHGTSEIVLLLPSREHRNRFDVDSVIESIEGFVTDVLERFKVIERNQSDSGSSSSKWKIVGGEVTNDVLQSMYKELLFEAWYVLASL
jgi:RNA-dependent RNA polymerase